MSTLPAQSDVVVVGGGVVGLSVAYELGRLGRAVLVLDRGEHARVATPACSPRSRTSTARPSRPSS